MNSEKLTGTERVIFGDVGVDAVRVRLDRYLSRHLGSPLVEVLFRSGRIDAVWAVHTGDGREVVVKAHRQPIEFPTLAATNRAQRLLVRAGFPPGPHSRRRYA